MSQHYNYYDNFHDDSSPINICYSFSCPKCRKKHIMFLNKHTKKESLTELSDRINDYVDSLYKNVSNHKSFFNNCRTRQERKEKWRVYAKAKLEKYIGEEVPWEFCDNAISRCWSFLDNLGSDEEMKLIRLYYPNVDDTVLNAIYRWCKNLA